MTDGWNPVRTIQRRCGNKYVNPTNASHRVDVLVSPRLNPASTTKFLRRARETAQRLPTVLPFSNACEKCHISPEIVNFPEGMGDGQCLSELRSTHGAINLLGKYPVRIEVKSVQIFTQKNRG